MPLNEPPGLGPVGRVWSNEIHQLADARTPELDGVRRALIMRGLPYRRRGPLASFVALTVAASAAGAFFLLRPHSAVHFEVEGSSQPGHLQEEISAQLTRPRALRFSDGSRVTLQPGAHARVEALSGAQTRVVLASGSAEVAVKKHPRQTFWIVAGRYQIAVQGAEFRVAWDAQAQVLSVARRDLDTGAADDVVISGPCVPTGQRVAPGTNARLTCPAPTPAKEAPATAKEAAAPVARVAAKAPRKSVAVAVPRPARAADAPAHLRRETEQLDRAWDALAGDPARALALASEGRRAFPNGALAEEREALVVLALERSHRTKQAARAAAAFLRRFPAAAFAPTMRRIAAAVP